MTKENGLFMRDTVESPRVVRLNSFQLFACQLLQLSSVMYKKKSEKDKRPQVGLGDSEQSEFAFKSDYLAPHKVLPLSCRELWPDTAPFKSVIVFPAL